MTVSDLKTKLAPAPSLANVVDENNNPVTEVVIEGDTVKLISEE